MQRDVTNVKPTRTHYNKGIHCTTIVMETGHRFALKDTQGTSMERERTVTEPRKEDNSGSQNWPESCSTTRGKPVFKLHTTDIKAECFHSDNRILH